MRHIFERDKTTRKNNQQKAKLKLIFSSISRNSNLLPLLRWNVLTHQTNVVKPKAALAPRCLLTKNKKRFCKLTKFSRHTFLKILRAGLVSGVSKAVW